MSNKEMIEAPKVAAILGGRKILHKDVHSLFDLCELIQHGLPKTSVDSMIKHLTLPKMEETRLKYSIIPSATFNRSKPTLSVDHSERVERIARVIATANKIWGDKQKASQFLTSAHALLHGKKPIEVAKSELGARQVEELLWQIYYGIPL